LDSDLETSYAEGEKGPGVGERIVAASKVSKISDPWLYVFPGWGTKDYWSANNRLHEVKVTVYGSVGPLGSTGGEETFNPAQTVEVHRVAFDDRFAYQGFPIGTSLQFAGQRFDPESGQSFPFKTKKMKELVVEVEILSVYSGDKWDDTCIAEMAITDGPKGQIRK
jgi:hypothetical protein